MRFLAGVVLSGGRVDFVDFVQGEPAVRVALDLTKLS